MREGERGFVRRLQGAVDSRNRNYAQIVKTLKFQRRKGLDFGEEGEERHNKLVEAALEAEDSDSEGGTAYPDEPSEPVQVQIFFTFLSQYQVFFLGGFHGVACANKPSEPV